MTYKPSNDPNYSSRLTGKENIPIKGRITQLIRAAQDAAFSGSQPVEDRDEIVAHLHMCRQELENLIHDRFSERADNSAQSN